MKCRDAFAAEAPKFEHDVLGVIYAGHGDSLPVSAFPVDGTFPTGTAKWEKRNIALEIPAWDTKTCIQCGKCAYVCPHAVIRIKVYDSKELAGAPATFKSTEVRDKDWAGLKYTIQVRPKTALDAASASISAQQRIRVKLALKRSIWWRNHRCASPNARTGTSSSRFLSLIAARSRSPIFASSRYRNLCLSFLGPVPGCGETPYLKLVSQLFGDRSVIANATGCSSIYGGNLPTTPWAKNNDGRGPAWSNSLFEDNAEFGLGFRLSIDKQTEFARELLRRLAGSIGDELVNCLADTRRRKMSLTFLSSAKRVELLKEKLQRPEHAGSQATAVRRRHAGEEKRLDRRRRRLGLRHRLRRSRSCAGERTQCERAGARHRGLFQYGRTSLEIHAAGGSGEIRGGRQTGSKKDLG